MQRILKNRPAILFFMLFLLNALDVSAQTTTSSSGNLLAGLMITVAVILAFVIWGMGNVLLALGKESLRKKASRSLPMIATLGFTLLAFSATSQDAAAPEVAAAAFNYGGLSATLFWVLSMVIFLEVLCILMLLMMIRRMQQELEPNADIVKESSLKEWWSRFDKKYFTKAVSIEKEADILLEHDYDGIRELDNSLPPWWKYGFIVTVIGSVIYMMYFHMGSGKDPIQEYEHEMEIASIALTKYNESAVDKVDENNLTMADAAGIEKGRVIYNMACWACHGKAGEGGTGPNLSDAYWIHKGGLSDIYLSIKNGYPDKGMQSWEKVYSKNEILYLSSYIKTMAGTNPPGAKDPQGDLWEEDGNAEETSTEVVADSTAL